MVINKLIKLNNNKEFRKIADYSRTNHLKYYTRHHPDSISLTAVWTPTCITPVYFTLFKDLKRKAKI